MSEILLIRHGETTWSASRRHTSYTDLELTPDGERQSRALAVALAGRRFVRVLSSPRQRATRTAHLAGLTVDATDPDLAEWNYGAYEGRTTADIHDENPAWNIWTDGCPDGESPAEVGARLDRVLDRVAPLLELSAGFSGDLTGRENLYLVGGLHGLSTGYLRRHFDEIVSFAGEQVEGAIDTSVRHYSSGMKVRLGFAVIAHLPHPVLLVDEVTAVGDAEFRTKCYATIERLLAEGRTLVLVSHNEKDLTRFCRRGLYLDAGRLTVDGTIDEALHAYASATQR